MKQNIYIDTDICDDIDDLWAVILALNVQEFNIIGISIAMGNTKEKARFVAKMLTDLKRTDIPVFVGESTFTSKNFHEEFYQDFSLSEYQGQISFGMIDTVALFKTVDRLTILGLAPLTNIRKIYELSPDLTQKARLVLMGGSLYKGYLFQDKPGPEYNILMDIEASKYVFEKIENCVLCPLDVCREFVIKGKNYDSLIASNEKSLKLLIANYFLWNQTYVGGAIKFDPYISSTILYDLIPLIYVLKPDYFVQKKVTFDVLDNGLTRVSEEGRYCIDSLIEWKSYGKEYDLIQAIYLGERFEKQE